ncbi:hypothetical protein [Acinetobacter vivianii]|uniref:hypothetical protein n=1 Tax=Acinetobacter vivianii TaxID=1776742 RepID=UPI00404369FA
MSKKMEVSSDLELQPSFMTLLSPEILLAHLDTDNHDWLAYDSDWFYKVEKKRHYITISAHSTHY